MARTPGYFWLGHRFLLKKVFKKKCFNDCELKNNASVASLVISREARLGPRQQVISRLVEKEGALAKPRREQAGGGRSTFAKILLLH